MFRYICRVMCTVNLMHVICTGACNPSCIRSVHVRSMQWTPLLVQSKRVSTRMRCEPPPPQSAGLGMIGTGTSACDHTYPLAMPRVAHVAAMPLWLVCFIPLSENHVRNNSFRTPLAEHVLLYMTTRNLSIPSTVSELTSTGCRDRSKKASITDGQDLQANHADFFLWPRQLDTESHPLTALKSTFSLTF